MTSAELWLMEHRQRERELAARAERHRRAQAHTREDLPDGGRPARAIPVVAEPRRVVDGRGPRPGWGWAALVRRATRARARAAATRPAPPQRGPEDPLCC